MVMTDSTRADSGPIPRTGGAGGKARGHTTSAFGPLAAAVRQAGLLERRTGWYVRLGAVILLGFAAAATGVVLLSHSWWALLLAIPAGLLSAQVGFFGHDAGHQQICTSRTAHNRLGLIAGDLVGGLSYGWWQDKHLRHHANPNNEDLDPDVGEGLISWSERQAARKTGVGRVFARHQAILFLPLVTLEGFNLLYASIASLKRLTRRERTIEISLLILHYGVYLGFLFTFLSPGQAGLFILIHKLIFGFNLGMSFAPNHKGMAMPEPGVRLDHLTKQVLTSRDVTGGWWVDVMLGGLNHQIEHHLFPNMPRPTLKKSKPLIGTYIRSASLPYRECGVLESYGECLAYLHRVGRAEETGVALHAAPTPAFAPAATPTTAARLERPAPKVATGTMTG